MDIISPISSSSYYLVSSHTHSCQSVGESAHCSASLSAASFLVLLLDTMPHHLMHNSIQLLHAMRAFPYPGNNNHNIIRAMLLITPRKRTKIWELVLSRFLVSHINFDISLLTAASFTLREKGSDLTEKEVNLPTPLFYLLLCYCIFVLILLFALLQIDAGKNKYLQKLLHGNS